MTQSTDWAELPYFLAVARSGSLRAAADQVGATHATVDRQIRALETAYGVRLFDRSKAGLTLTEAGEELVPLAEAAEVAVIGARRRLKGLDREAAGVVRLTAAPTMCYSVLPPILADFANTHPDIEVEVIATNRMKDLSRSEADVSLRIAYEVADDVVGRRVLQYATAIYASQDYIEKHWPKRGPKGEGLTWIGWREPVMPPAWVTDSPFPKAALRHGSRDGLTVAEFVKQGMGMSYFPCYIEAFTDNLVRVPGTEAKLDRSLWLLLHTDLKRVTRVRLLVEFLSAELRKRRAMFLGPLA